MFTRSVADSGLYFGQLPILESVRDNDGCSQTDIAELLHVSPASIALSTKRLSKAGLLDKKAQEGNLRCNSLMITDKGRAAVKKCRAAFDELDAKMFDGFSADDFRCLKEYLDRMITNLEISEECANKIMIDDFEKKMSKGVNDD